MCDLRLWTIALLLFAPFGPVMAQTPKTASKETSRPVEKKPAVVTAKPVIYDITMKTVFVMPKTPDEVSQIRVWHALPTVRPWTEPSAEFGASDVKYSDGGEKQYEQEQRSHHIFWNANESLKPGSQVEFTSQFTVKSFDRNYFPLKSTVKWQIYNDPLVDSEGQAVDLPTIRVEPQVTEIAATFRKRASPAQAIVAMAEWLQQNIRYDASVQHRPQDVSVTLAARKGHCAHYFALAQQFCTALGIPSRQVFGMNLSDPTGYGALSKVRGDYCNIHTWGEVFLPGVGWVEFEPATGKKTFSIGSNYIQNNPWFQNYSVWIRKNGSEQVPEWRTRSGGFTSEYQLEHIIAYKMKRVSE
jgi:transglutaminase-like putative cysteine protease